MLRRTQMARGRPGDPRTRHRGSAREGHGHDPGRQLVGLVVGDVAIGKVDGEVAVECGKVGEVAAVHLTAAIRFWRLVLGVTR